MVSTALYCHYWNGWCGEGVDEILNKAELTQLGVAAEAQLSLVIRNYYLVVSLTESDQAGLVDLNIGSNINYDISGSVYTVLALAIERYLTLSGHNQGNKVRYTRVTR